MAALKKLPAIFYSTGAREPVRDWLKALDKDDRVSIGNDIQTVELGWPMGLPVCKSMGEGLWEIRSDLIEGRIARVFFGIIHGKMVLLHGIIKKSKKTPPHDLELARNRFKKAKDAEHG
jgi:phage-related protein